MTTLPQLRPYQLEAIDALQRDLALGSAMVEAATGTGKTSLIAEIARREVTLNSTSRILAVAHRKELLDQLQKRFELFGLTVCRSIEKFEESSANVLVASIASLGRRIKKSAGSTEMDSAGKPPTLPKPDTFDLMIVDECFPAGTLVDNKPIESLRIGDLVTSYNHRTGRIEHKPVKRLYRSQPNNLVTVYLDDGLAITCTPGHPFYTSPEYTPAVMLNAGDCVYGYSLREWSKSSRDRVQGSITQIARVVRVEIHEPRSDGQFGELCSDGFVYNIEVADNHNYFVGGVLVHNCHHAPASGYQTVINYYRAKLMGVTASPDRADGAGLGHIFKRCSYRYTIDQAIEDKWLVPVCGIKIDVPGMDLSKVRRRKFKDASEQAPKVVDGLHPKDLATVMLDPIVVEGITKPLVELAGNRQTIVFAVDRSHARALTASLETRGARAAWVDGSKECRRAEVLKSFEDSKIQFLVNVLVLTEGYDHPPVSCVAMCRPTESRILYSQSVGRGLRLSEGKTDCLVLDFSGTSDKFSLVGPEDVLAGALIENQKMKVAGKAPSPIVIYTPKELLVKFASRVVDLIKRTGKRAVAATKKTVGLIERFASMFVG